MLCLGRFKMIKIGQKWNYPDAVYKRKKVSTWIVELIGGTNRGAEIRVWNKIDKNSIDGIFDKDGNYELSVHGHYMDYTNALGDYRDIQNVDDIMNFMQRNM
jgi:hypothetical protein